MDAEEAKRQSQKMEALGRLAGGVAHDFNNLLTAINGYADLLMSVMSKSDPNHEMAEEIRKAGEKGTALTRQLLAFSRKQIADIRAQDTRPMLSDMEKLLGRLLPKQISLQLIPSEEAMIARLDRSLAEQAIINLVVNARDAMPKGGQVRLTLKREVVEAWADSAPLKPQPGEFIVVNVEDNGMGMSLEVMAHLFEPFFTTKAKGRGTGLGLSTVFGIMQQLDGGLRVTSEAGRGSIFALYFPASPIAAHVSEAAESLAAPRGKGEKIALVESDDAVRRLTRRIMQQGGYIVAEFTDSRSIAAASDFDAAILERRPRGLDGVEVGAELLDSGHARAIILLGGSMSEAEASQLPAKLEILPKPYGSADLLHALRRLLDS